MFKQNEKQHEKSLGTWQECNTYVVKNPNTSDPGRNSNRRSSVNEPDGMTTSPGLLMHLPE
jgi:hypothetical protein